MTNEQKSLPKWVVIVSALFALMELWVSFTLWIDPKTVLETVDLTAHGVDYVINMWAVRQFALGVIFGYATFKKSVPMLTIAYIFLLVMFAGDGTIGFVNKDTSLMTAALIMCAISSAILFAINKRK